MKYYKIINSDRQVIDALIDEEISYVKFQQRNKLLVNCAKDEAQGFLSYDLLNVYRTEDMIKFPSNCNYQYEEVTLKEITEDDYNILRKALDESKPIEPEPEPTPEPEPEPDEPEVDDNTLELVKTSKVSKMSKACNKVITNGFDAVLSDGKSHHFSLTLDDQANLSTLSADMITGSKTLPYHADGEECQFFSVEDMTKIITTAKEFKTYQITYFNSLKLYILSLDDINVIDNIKYCDKIPNEHKSEVLLMLEQQLNDNSTSSDGDTGEEN
jgi:hypothetical protein